MWKFLTRAGKESPNDKNRKEIYLTNLAQMEVKVSLVVNKKQEELKQWENDFFAEHGRAASVKDALNNSKRKGVEKQVKYGKVA